MPRTRISEFSATAADNTDIDSIDIAEGCAPSGINNAIRELMAQLKDMQTGASGDTFTLTTVNSTTMDTTNLEVTNLKAKDGTAAGSIADSTGVVTLASAVLTTADINGGTVDGATIGGTTPAAATFTSGVISANSSSNALRITQTGTGNALLVEDSANPDATPFVVNQFGQVISGAAQTYVTTVNGTDYRPQFQIHGAAAGTPAIGYEAANWATTSGAGSFSFAKSRGGVIGTHAVVSSGDSVGETYYFGSDGTNFIEAARIGAAVDGTPGTNDMPGRLVFSTTADGASSPTERMRIANTGLVTLAATSGLLIGRTAVTAPAATDGNVFSGTYTPTLTNVTNVDASTAYSCQYMRVGNVVTVSGRIAIDATATGPFEVRVTLPVASNFANANEAGGTFIVSGSAGFAGGSVYADVSNDVFVFNGVAAGTANLSYYFTATYRVI